MIELQLHAEHTSTVASVTGSTCRTITHNKCIMHQQAALKLPQQPKPTSITKQQQQQDQQQQHWGAVSVTFMPHQAWLISSNCPRQFALVLHGMPCLLVAALPSKVSTPLGWIAEENACSCSLLAPRVT
jgi:hypothetical protein